MCVDSVDFDFSDNYITVFYGANGSGKSTIFEAVALCWTERRRGDSYKDFIMHGADSAEIHLTASVRNEPIQFDIEIRDKKGSTPFQRKITYKGAEYVNSECTTLLNSFDIDYLQHIMFSMQGENNITELRPAERTKLLKRIFNFEFEAQLGQLDKLVEQEEQNMLVLKTRADVMSHSKFDYEEEEKLLEASELKKIETRIKDIEATLKTQEQNQLLQAESAQRLESLQAQGVAAKNRKHAIDIDISSLENSRTRLTGDKQQHTQAILTLPDPVRLEADIVEKATAIESLSRLVGQNKKYIEEKIEALTARHSSILELKNHIEAHKAGKCPKCGQNTSPDAVPSLEQSLEKILKEYEDLTAQRATLEIDERTAERTIAKYQIEIPNLREKITTTASTKIQFESILKTLEESIQQTDNSIQTRKSTLVEVEKQIKDLERQIDEIAPKMIRLASTQPLLEEKSRLSNQIQENLAVIARNEVIKRKNLEVEKKEKDNKKALSDLNKQQNDILLSVNNYKEAKRILEVDLPNYIIIKACSKLEKHINHFISGIKPGMVVRLFQARSGVEFFYSPKGEVAELDDWTSTKMASGFERELLSAAWRVALARAYNLHALMLDEVDSAANTFSSEKMFREIANLTGFEQLFIISHKPEVVDILLQENDKVTSYYVSDGTFTRQEY
jgi:DNA repair exonuclease SbcCD ATPase subunit